MTQKIEFFSTVPGLEDAYPVLPMKEYKAEWMNAARQSYIEVNKERNDKFTHVYQCPGIFDLYKQGFVVRMWHDVIIKTDKTRKGFGMITPSNELENPGKSLVDLHKDELSGFIPTRPHSLPNVLKFNTPWNVIAPKGVKFLVLPIAYPDSHEFESAIGILDPSISTEINFQVWWNVLDGEYLLKAGTPMVHLIPFREETFELENRAMTDTDKAWIEKKKYFNNFSFRPKRNIIKEIYHKHFKVK